METTDDHAAALRAAERGAAAPYLDYQPPPGWLVPAAGVWGALMAGGLGLTYGEHAWGFWLIAVALGAEAWYLRWYRRERGLFPAMRRAPAPLFALMLRMYALGFAGIALTAVAGALAGWVAAAVTAGVACAALIGWYEAAYARVAAKVRARLG